MQHLLSQLGTLQEHKTLPQTSHSTSVNEPDTDECTRYSSVGNMISHMQNRVSLKRFIGS